MSLTDIDMEAIIERPTLQDQRVARASLPLVHQALSQKPTGEISVHFQQEASSVTIPLKALHLLAVILSSMAEGKAVSLLPAEAELSTQQAAEVLNVSRPHVVKLLEEGTIPFRKVGSHRRIRLEDVLSYQAQQQRISTERIEFLAQQAQELQLGYE